MRKAFSSLGEDGDSDGSGDLAGFLVVMSLSLRPLSVQEEKVEEEDTHLAFCPLDKVSDSLANTAAQLGRSKQQEWTAGAFGPTGTVTGGSATRSFCTGWCQGDALGRLSCKDIGALILLSPQNGRTPLSSVC